MIRLLATLTDTKAATRARRLLPDQRAFRGALPEDVAICRCVNGLGSAHRSAKE